MNLDLNKLAHKIDDALVNETSETLKEWLSNKRMTNDKTLSAVSWLANHLSVTDRAKYNGVIETAKEIEKMQHGDTWDKAIETVGKRGVSERAICDFDEYYNEIYEARNFGNESNGEVFQGG
jgi:uncharacterized protein (DUF2342 family)